MSTATINAANRMSAAFAPMRAKGLVFMIASLFCGGVEIEGALRPAPPEMNGGGSLIGQ